MKLYPFILALVAIGASTPILAGQGGAPAAQAANAPGVTDTEIKIGQTMPYSGPISGYGTIGKAELAYFRMINEAAASTDERST
jgi:branched-chain amino acid transport system substrate-binding protein